MNIKENLPVIAAAILGSAIIGVVVPQCAKEYSVTENKSNSPSNFGSRIGGQLDQKDFSDIAIFGRPIR